MWGLRYRSPPPTLSLLSEFLVLFLGCGMQGQQVTVLECFAGSVAEGTGWLAPFSACLPGPWRPGLMGWGGHSLEVWRMLTAQLPCPQPQPLELDHRDQKLRSLCEALMGQVSGCRALHPSPGPGEAKFACSGCLYPVLLGSVVTVPSLLPG